MRKLYIYLSMITGMLFMLAMGTQAQRPVLKAADGTTIYAAVAADPDGYFTTANKGGIVTFGSNTPYADPMNRICEESEMVLAGTMVKKDNTNTYYAMFANAAGQPSDFCTVDFATGKKTRLGAASAMATMFYDDTNDVLYGFGWNGDGSELYSINVENGVTTLLASFPEHKIVAALVTYGIIKGITVESKIIRVKHNNTPIVLDVTGTLYKDAAGSPKVKVDAVGQSLYIYNNETYWLGYGNVNKNDASQAFIASLNFTWEVTKLGDAAQSFGAGKAVRLTGMCFDMTSGGTTVEPEGEDFYYSVYSDDMDANGGLFKSNLADPYNSTQIAKYVADDYGFDYGVGFRAAAMADGKYYAVRWDNGYNTIKDLCTVNLENGEMTVVGAFDKSLSGMAYDAKNKIMYGVEVIQGGAVDPEGPDPLLKEEGNTDKSIIYKINLTDGTTEVACEINNKTLVGIAAAKDGTIYAMSETAMCTLDLKNATATDVVAFKGFKPNRNAGHSLVFLRSDLYWLGNGYPTGGGTPSSYIAKINLSTGDVTKVGDQDGKLGKNNYTGLYIVQKTKVAKMLAKRTMYGDIQGVRPMTEESTYETFYYNSDNLLSRMIYNGWGYKNDNSRGDLMPIAYTTYVYNDKNQLVETYLRQWKQVGVEMKYLAPSSFVRYTYDEKGNLAKQEEDDRLYYLYEYDNAGNKVKEVKMQNNGEWYEMYTQIFSDFLPGAKNSPQKVECDGLYNNIYTGEWTYDDKFNMTSYTTWNEDKSPRYKKEYEYNEDGILIKTKVYNPDGDGFKLSSTVDYVVLDENNIEERPQQMIYYKRTFAEFDGDTAPSNLQIENVSTATSPNTYKLTCDAPESTSVENPAWDIYCDGILKGRVTSLDENGKIVYIDKEVSNDMMHDWFVQTVDVNGERGCSISNTVTLEDIQTELVPVTAAEIVSYETIEGKNYPYNLVTVSWTAPDSQMPLLGYNLYVGNMALSENFDDGLITTTQGVVDLGPTEYDAAWMNTVTVEAVYSIGSIKSEKFTLDVRGWGSIESNDLSSLIELGDNRLTIHGDYTSLDLYNASGAKVKSVSGVSQVDLSSLPRGIYMIRISHDGKADVLKTVVK